MHRERHVKLCLTVDLSFSSDALPTVSPCASRSRHTIIRDGYTERDAGADADAVSLCNLVFFILIFIPSSFKTCLVWAYNTITASFIAERVCHFVR